MSEPVPSAGLRLWPGVLLLLAQWAARFGLPVASPDHGGFGVLGGLAGGLAILLWWAFFSRLPGRERLGGALLVVAAMVVTFLLLDESMAQGAQGMILPIYATPLFSLVLVGYAVVRNGLAPALRGPALVGGIALACGGWTLVRTEGVSGSAGSDFAWRWSPTSEELLLESTESLAETPAATATGDPPAAAEWPGFRGAQRNSVVRGTSINPDWNAAPPREMWRRPIGPAWSSFAVQGGLLYTQEQRGEQEMVACYRLADGEPVWRHADPVRFWESNAGAGPRATPTLHGTRVFALGATGLLNCLDRATGELHWSRDAAAETGSALPEWGFCGSPLVVDDLVIVATAGRLVAFEVASGEPRWVGPDGGGGYSSPHALVQEGIAQVVLASDGGVTAVAPADGTLLWRHDWSGSHIVQPALTAGGDLLIGAAGNMGGTSLRRLALTREDTGWTLSERWTSRRFKPYFNDFVVHRDHAYGFDGSILACVELEAGERRWKGGRYGNGQVLLLADQDLLLVLGEYGELALVRATTEESVEVALTTVLEGKTWNHPVLVGDVLLVRNSEEMAAYRLATTDA